MLTYRYIGKIILSLFLAFLASSLLAKYVFYPTLPQIRPEFKKTVANAPKLIADTTRKVTNQAVLKWQEITQLVPPHRPTAVLPPPWTSSDSSVVPPTNPPPQPTTYLPPRGGNPPASPTGGPPTTYIPSPTSQPPPTATPQLPTVTPLPPGNTLTQEEQETVNLINQRRQQMGLSTLSVNFQLVAAARRHSQNMKNRNFCGHTGSDNSTPWTRAREAGYNGSVYGETVGCGYPTAAAVVDAWWGSPGHKAVLTFSGTTVIGVGWWERRQTAVVGY